jgi:hypothetical protein
MITAVFKISLRRIKAMITAVFKISLKRATRVR